MCCEFAMPAGRPSEYDPALCDILDGMGNDGEGVAEAIVALGISRDSFYRWQDIHEEFSDAVKQMKARSQAWWESKGRLATFGGVDGFNATSFVFNMKNRFREDWSDMVKNEHTGKDGKPIQTEEVGQGAAKLAAALEQIAERRGTSGEPSAE